MPNSDDSNPTRSSRIRTALRALSHRNYRLFFGGQAVSLIGTWMQSVALSWLVYQLTGSALLLGVLGFAGQITTFVVSPFAGVFADRWNLRRTLIGTQSLMMLQASVLAGIVLGNIAAVWQILLLSAFLGLVNGFDMPARQAFVLQIVEEREDLPNAIALNSAVFNGARLVGPSVAGLVVAAVGEGMCFLINAVSYLAVVAALYLISVSRQAARRPISTGAVQQFREGYQYAFGFPPIRAILLMLALISLVGMPYTVLAPIFAGKVLGGGAHTLGFLMGATGVGALIGALFLASRRTVLGLGRWIPIAAAIFGVGLIGFSFSRVLWVSLIMMVLTGFGAMVNMASSNTLLQTIVEDEKRGRVMAFYTMAFAGTAPFGSLAAGAIAARIGAPMTVLIGGACSVAGAIVFSRMLPSLRELVRPVYAQMGIIPEVASGVQAATEIREPPEELS